VDKLKHPTMICKKQSIPVGGDIEMVVSCKIEFEFPRNKTYGILFLILPRAGSDIPRCLNAFILFIQA
jgi:hypothetical protein